MLFKGTGTSREMGRWISRSQRWSHLCSERSIPTRSWNWRQRRLFTIKCLCSAFGMFYSCFCCWKIIIINCLLHILSSKLIRRSYQWWYFSMAVVFNVAQEFDHSMAQTICWITMLFMLQLIFDSDRLVFSAQNKRIVRAISGWRIKSWFWGGFNKISNHSVAMLKGSTKNPNHSL